MKWCFPTRVMATAAAIAVWTVMSAAGCSAPEPIRLLKGTGGGGRLPDAGSGSGGGPGFGAAVGTGGFIIFGSGGITVATGGSFGTGGMVIASGGAPSTGGVVGSGGVPATGGAGTAGSGSGGQGGPAAGGGMVGTGGRGSGGAGGGGGSAGRGTGGGAAGMGAGGAIGGSRGTGGRGGAGGANCVTAIQAANYTAGTLKCADCRENGVSRAATCTALVDCIGAGWPCSGNCRTNCDNTVGANSVASGCVDAIMAAAMCN